MLDKKTRDSIKERNTFVEYGSELLDEDVCPYVVFDILGRHYWWSPVFGEAVVVQTKEGNA